MISLERNFLALFSSVFYSQDVQACAFGYKEDEMKFRRILIPAVVIVTMLVQFIPGTVLGPRPVAAVTACDAAEFVADVTIPDGTSFAPGAAMVKTWRLKNTGTCTWSTSYAIAFTAGSKMGAPSAVNLPSSVAPGATVDVTVNMTAPTASGHYRGNWMLRNASNVLFGVGPFGTWTFFVDIVVSAGSTPSYDFVGNACSAVWTSGAGSLTCPGTDGDAKGFIQKLDAPKLENGTTGPASLLTAPQNITDGYIQGVYPAILVQSGDHFRSILNCQFGATGCFVTFQLNYQIGTGPVQTLKSFKEKIDGLYYNLDVSLSSLAGQNVSFILKVLATGSPTGDRAVWSGPQITHAGGPIPPPTSGCDKGTFVADVTIPDGTSMAGGAAFVKTWRVKNTGTCTWTTSYRLVFAGGDYMGVTASAFILPSSVAPGGTIDLSLNMIAPITPGIYFSHWKLRNASGADFGLGASGTNTFFAKINVASSYSTAYSFAANASSAAWSSGAGALPFPGADGDSRGFALPLGSHHMEDNTTSPEGLLTFPQSVTDGYIQGIYPAFTVQNGDHLQSYVGCQYGGPATCNVIFRLAYQIGANPVVNLGTATEVQDGLVFRMDSDLSALAGQNVKFILRLEAFGSATGDRAVWSQPRIVRSGVPVPPPPPTPTPFVGPNADLSISINDGASGYTKGGSTTYTVVVNNAGPYSVTGASVLVTKPTQITNWIVTCVPDAGATCTAGPTTPAGNFSDLVNLPVSKKITYTIVASISASATGNIVATATITNPGPTPDPNMANNTATDTDAGPSADLAITISDGISTWPPGGTTTYSAVVINNGPLDVTGAVFNDNKPAQVVSWTWTCAPDSGASCGAGGSAAPITDTANIPAGKKVIYTIVATLSTSIPGNLVNTVTITPPVVTPDPDMSNNTAADTDIGPTADLSVTKTDGVSYYEVGTRTYTIRVFNNGPQTVIGATFSDTLPAPQVTGWSWTCVPDFSSTCSSPGPIGAVTFSDTINLAVGQGVTYTVVATIGTVSGNLVNTASISAPGAIPDPVPANNSATDTDAPPTADLAITKTDGISIYPPGGDITYTIVVSNNGPVDAIGAVVNDNILVTQITSWIWSCVADSGATCTSPGVPSAANFTDIVNIPAGKKITYTVVASVSAASIGAMTNLATVASPGPALPDPILGNNSASDTDAHPSADLAVTISDGVLTYVPVPPGAFPLIYTIVVTNAGPSNVVGAVVSDTLPAGLLSWDWSCVPDLGATCTGAAPAPGVFTDTVNIPVGKRITYTVRAVISSIFVAPIVHTVTVAPPAVIIDDTNLVNNTAVDTDTLAP
jgi:uncharacterized repeat protein (TIGR01451 family)